MVRSFVEFESERSPLQCNYAEKGHLSKFFQIDYWHFKSFKIVTKQNDHKSVAFVMFSFITLIICWKTFVNLCDFHSLNL